MKKQILVFYGFKGSGKDTCYELTYTHYSSCSKLSFAEPLRETVWSLFKHRIEDKDRIWGSIEKKEEVITTWPISEHIRKSCGFTETHWTGRRLLQWFGTEVIRYASQDTWTDFMKRRIEASFSPVICITDCRFHNEYDMIGDLRNEGYRVLFCKVERNIENNEFSLHASERDIAEFFPDVTIYNTGDLDDLVKELNAKVWIELPKVKDNGYI